MITEIFIENDHPERIEEVRSYNLEAGE